MSDYNKYMFVLEKLIISINYNFVVINKWQTTLIFDSWYWQFVACIHMVYYLILNIASIALGFINFKCGCGKFIFDCTNILLIVFKYTGLYY